MPALAMSSPPCTLTPPSLALPRMPPVAATKAGRRPPTLNFPEDEIVRAYYRRHPSASLEPVDLGSFEPSTARRFAARQMELMESGMPRREARAQTEEEFAAAAAASGGAEAGIVAQVQREEEQHLKQALATYVERHGHKPLSQMLPQRPVRENAMRAAARDLPAPPVASSAAETAAGTS